MDNDSERRLQLKRDFGEFLDADQGQNDYTQRIKAALSRANVEAGKLRLGVDVHDLREHNRELLHSLLADPSECITPFEEALDEFVRAKFPKTLLDSQQARPQRPLPGAAYCCTSGAHQLSCTCWSAFAGVDKPQEPAGCCSTTGCLERSSRQSSAS